MAHPSMNEVCDRLYIGDLMAAQRALSGETSTSEAVAITHVLTVCNNVDDLAGKMSAEEEIFNKVNHRVIECIDNLNEDLLNNECKLHNGVLYIKRALEESTNNRVLVHW